MPLLLPLLLTLLAQPAPHTDAGTAPAADPYADWVALDNGTLRLAVDPTRGAAIGYLALSATQRNVLNHHDTGRFIQQSYYGDADGSTWNQQPWTYNPVQGGAPDRTPATVHELTVDADAHTLYARVTPRLWCDDPRDAPEAVMEQWITLTGPVAHVRYRFTYTGPAHTEPRHQEVPAVFIDAAFPTLVRYAGDAPWTNAPLTAHTPGWPNEYHTADEHWFAYAQTDNLDDHPNALAVGVYTPDTSELTAYRYAGNNTQGPNGAACSYAAPIATFALTPSLVHEYHAYLTLGPIPDIRQRFTVLREANNESTNDE